MCSNELTCVVMCMSKAIAWLGSRLFVDMIRHNLA